jgi:iron complex transport system ATP-binding protein
MFKKMGQPPRQGGFLMSSLIIKNLSFCYDNSTQVIDNVSFTVNKSATWAIIGKNGSGKSTLIKCLARLEPVKFGSILLDDRELFDYSTVELSRKCAYVPQATLRIPPNFTIEEYVIMGRYPYCGFPLRYSENDRKIAVEAMQLTDTYKFRKRSMKALSGGELQRVFIAGAVAQRTGVMLLDEPVSFLDPMHQEMIHSCLERIHSEYDTTLLTVTHDINAALRRNTHILALSDGVSVYQGTTDTFLSDPLSKLEEIYGISFETASATSSSSLFFLPRCKEQ